MPTALIQITGDTLRYWRAFAYYARGGKFEGSKQRFFEGDRRSACHVFGAALAVRLWHRPHYRTTSYAEDLRVNLSNVAVPGTGLALSSFCGARPVAVGFLLIGAPCWSFVAAVAKTKRDTGSYFSLSALAANYGEQLLKPRDWFSLWRTNSRLAAWHSLCVKKEQQNWGDYAMENKWLFIEKGRRLNVAVSPVLETPALCIKHKNEEGGMGIHFFRNALEGGDWILQEVMANEDFVASLLPENAPLSTFRVMTASRLGLSQNKKGVEAISCVFRAGRRGAATDHDSILFDVDVKTGTIGRGTTNMQWYKLGPRSCCLLGGSVRWAPPPDILDHPDCPGKRVTGAIVPGFQERVAALATEAHRKLLPTVPLAGWDVVLSKDHGACLLEANLSCNFFRGSFDEDRYVQFIHDYFADCDGRGAL